MPILLMASQLEEVPEEDFEVVGQLRSSGVAWVHGDTDVAGGHQSKLGALEQEHVDLLLDGADDAQNLSHTYDINLFVMCVAAVHVGVFYNSITSHVYLEG